ncbi:hypothetical protein AB0I35_16420 [Nocardia sp. NPDC050378]|uniref:hypothetical protein n=1 Tax=Nocardia sp. NPDC050378 TaxID=3155400 RepID=UPI0033C5CF36
MSDTETVEADRPTAEQPKTGSEDAAEEQISSSAEPAGDDAEPAAGRRARVVRFARRAAVPALALVAIVAVAAAVFLGTRLRHEQAVDDAAAAAVTAARAYGVTLTSVDSTRLDSDFAAVLDGSTGEFRDMYTRSSGQLRELLQQNKATGKGTVLEAAVKSATETEVEVLLFIDQTVTNAASADPRIDRSRVLMTMQLVDGRWLASRVYLP